METVTLKVPESQVVDWVRNPPPTTKRAVLLALIPGLDELDALVDYGSERMRQLCAQRDIDWDHLTEEERLRLVDDLLHEES
jgi:hypothetical protein